MSADRACVEAARANLRFCSFIRPGQRTNELRPRTVSLVFIFLGPLEGADSQGGAACGPGSLGPPLTHTPPLEQEGSGARAADQCRPRGGSGGPQAQLPELGVQGRGARGQPSAQLGEARGPEGLVVGVPPGAGGGGPRSRPRRPGALGRPCAWRGGSAGRGGQEGCGGELRASPAPGRRWRGLEPRKAGGRAERVTGGSGQPWRRARRRGAPGGEGAGVPGRGSPREL